MQRVLVASLVAPPSCSCLKQQGMLHIPPAISFMISQKEIPVFLWKSMICLIFLMDVAVLSSQKLTALKDVIKCEADANMKSQRQDRPNGYFYIEVSYT